MRGGMVCERGMGGFLAVRLGLADAWAGKPPYFWGLLSDRGQREAMIKDGWKSVGRVFILALVLDAVYQLIVLHAVYFGEMIIAACVLAIVPYLILRVLLTRLARKAEAQRPANTPVLRS